MVQINLLHTFVMCPGRVPQIPGYQKDMSAFPPFTELQWEAH